MQENLETLFKYIEPAKLLEWGFQAIQFFLVILIALIILKVIKASIHRVGAKMQSRTADVGEQKRIDTLMRVFDYLANIIILLIGALIALGTIGISIGPILAAAGVVGLAVGFGAQSLVKDYFTGVVLLMENQIRAGDVIEIASRAGTVETVTLRYVRIRDLHGNVHFVPNGQISAVCNMTMDYGYSLMEIGVAYKENADEAMAIMQKVGDTMAEEEAYKAKIL
ncbi:MAG: mechanosensitive ion channel, partial [Limnobacter sp.]|nr:mechanosensitive ion channel [Limnobacter sp.]